MSLGLTSNMIYKPIWFEWFLNITKSIRIRFCTNCQHVILVDVHQFEYGFFNGLPIGPFNGGQFSKSLIEHTVNPKQSNKCIPLDYIGDDRSTRNIAARSVDSGDRLVLYSVLGTCKQLFPYCGGHKPLTCLRIKPGFRLG